MAVVTPAASFLAEWAVSFEPRQADLELAERSLRDTAAVIAAGSRHPLRHLFDQLTPVGRLAALAHVQDFDDLHMPSTTHISAVCVPAALGAGCGGGAHAYLAGAGVMARLGIALGWRHYSFGWHTTCTAGAPAAAVAAGVARGLDADGLATAIALAVPAAGGVQRAFGTAGKPLQVGFAAEAGVRAAELASAGASADPRALDEWIALVGGEVDRLGRGEFLTETVPGGLAVKLFPCCYALQRPIAAVLELGPLDVDSIEWVRITTPAASLKPLIHSRPTTGLEGKFSLEYGVAATLLGGRPMLETFTDEAVQRVETARLMELVEIVAIEDDSAGLLDGALTAEVALRDGSRVVSTVELPPGAPGRPPSEEELRAKIEACAGTAAELVGLSWDRADELLELI